MSIISWFSTGVTSAVATKIALEQYSNVRIIYIDIATQHPDSLRFLKDCQDWFGQEIEIHRSEKYTDHFDVIEKTRYINGAYGARCSLELKKKVRYKIEDESEWDGQGFGFDFSKHEIERAERFKKEYPDSKPVFPLIDAKLNKGECHGILLNAGIKQPKMYDLGYPNNNCVGCVKGGAGYWNAIRRDFPITFERMAKLEREINHTCLKETKDGETVKVYLDELDPNKGNYLKPILPDCGMFCQTEFDYLNTQR